MHGGDRRRAPGAGGTVHPPDQPRFVRRGDHLVSRRRRFLQSPLPRRRRIRERIDTSHRGLDRLSAYGARTSHHAQRHAHRRAAVARAQSQSPGRGGPAIGGGALMAGILLAIIGWDPKGWDERFRTLAPQHEINLWPERVGDPESISYACVWNPPRGALTGFPKLRAVFSLGAGADEIVGDPSLPRVPVVRVVDPDITMRMTEYVTLNVLMYHRRLRQYEAQQ